MKLQLSKYVKTDDIQHGDEIVILNQGETKESEKFTNPDGSPKVQYEFKVRLKDGSEKFMNINKTSLRAITDVYGSDTALWVGKTMVAHSGIGMSGKKMILLNPKEA